MHRSLTADARSYNADHFHKTANHSARLDPKRFHIDEDKLQWYIRKYRSHFLYWTNVPIKKLLVRYEDLRADPATELRRVVHFLLDNPTEASALVPKTSASSSLSWITPFAREERPENTPLARALTLVDCAVEDGRIAYQSQASQHNHLFSIGLLGEERVQVILRELAPILCQLGYHELFPRWLAAKAREGGGAQVAAVERYRDAHVDCASMETVVDYEVKLETG